MKHVFNFYLFIYIFFGCRIQRSFQRIEIEDFLEIKRSLSMRCWHRQRFMLGICRFTLQRSKFTSCFPELEKSRRSSWAWIRTQKHPAASASFCKTHLQLQYDSHTRIKYFYSIILGSIIVGTWINCCIRFWNVSLLDPCVMNSGCLSSDECSRLIAVIH